MASGGALMPCCAIAPGATSALDTTSNPPANVFIFLPQPIQFVNHKGPPAPSWKSRDQKEVRFWLSLRLTLMQFRVRRNVSGGLMSEGPSLHSPQCSTVRGAGVLRNTAIPVSEV